MSILPTLSTKIIIILLLGGYSFAESPIASIASYNKAAYTYEDFNWSATSYSEYIQQVMNYQENMQSFHKSEVAWKILERYDEQMKLPRSHVIGDDAVTWQNLQILCGEQASGRSAYIGHLVDRTSTEIGRVTLCSWIAQPLDDYEELARRQSNVRLLTEDSDLFSILEDLLSTFKKSENFFLSFWNNDPFKRMAVPEKPSGDAVVSWPFMNSWIETVENSIPLLTYARCVHHVTTLMTFGLNGLSALILPVYGALKIAAKISVLLHKGPLLANGTNAFLDKAATPLIGSGGYLSTLYSYSSNDAVKGMGALMAGLLALNRTNSARDWVLDGFTFNNCLQKKLHHVAKCLHSLEMMGTALLVNPVLTLSSGVSLHELIQKLKTTQGPLQDLFAILDEPTFKGEPSLIANYGAIYRAYRLLHENLKELEPLLCALGDLDVYMSTARLYKEFKDKRVHYTFAHYALNSPEPRIALKELWSPFIDPAVVVPNSIELCKSKGANNLIVTGPNEGGKSTFVKAIAVTLILAQSIGIVPATEAVITPFSYIGTYLNITDDHGKSLFEAQVQRTKHILEHVRTMASQRYSFLLIDELFNGTEGRIGQAASCSIADYLSKNAQVISVFPTHFQQLTSLEGNGRSVNYRVSAQVDKQGTITYPFTIERGISTQNTVLDILRSEGFDRAIIEQASKLIESKQ
ncbi:hypothetical protein H0W26_01000 [Candidatus Dependentiae bacterium]|nr:hypothetical protein [Candidatus Dependentiae bacterium]